MGKLKPVNVADLFRVSNERTLWEWVFKTYDFEHSAGKTPEPTHRHYYNALEQTGRGLGFCDLWRARCPEKGCRRDEEITCGAFFGYSARAPKRQLVHGSFRLPDVMRWIIEGNRIALCPSHKFATQ